MMNRGVSFVDGTAAAAVAVPPATAAAPAEAAVLPADSGLLFTLSDLFFLTINPVSRLMCLLLKNTNYIKTATLLPMLPLHHSPTACIAYITLATRSCCSDPAWCEPTKLLTTVAQEQSSSGIAGGTVSLLPAATNFFLLFWLFFGVDPLNVQLKKQQNIGQQQSRK